MTFVIESREAYVVIIAAGHEHWHEIVGWQPREGKDGCAYLPVALNKMQHPEAMTLAETSRVEFRRIGSHA